MENIFNRFLVRLSLLLLALTPVLSSGAANTAVSNTALSNTSVFTGHYYRIPSNDSIFPEVQDFTQPDPFLEVYKPDDESVLRRFEVVTLISFPPVFFLGNIIIRTVYSFQKGTSARFYDHLPAAYNWILYPGCGVICAGIALNDYRLTRRAKKDRGLEWPLINRKF